MVCKECGKTIPDQALFCPRCGSKVTSYAEAPKSNVAEENVHSFSIKDSMQKTILYFAIVIVAILILGIISVIFVPKARLRAKISLGDKYLSEMDYDNAIVAYETALTIDPKSEMAYEGLAKSYAGKGNYYKAAKVIELGLSKARGVDSLQMLQSEITQKIYAVQKAEEELSEKRGDNIEKDEDIDEKSSETIEETEDVVDDAWIDAYISYLSKVNTFDYPECRMFYLNDDHIPEVLLEGTAHYLGSIALTIGKDNSVNEYRFGDNYASYIPQKNIVYDSNSGAGGVNDDISCIKEGDWETLFFGAYLNDRFDPVTGDPIGYDFEIFERGFYEEGAGTNVPEEIYYHMMKTIFEERGYEELDAKMIDEERSYSISELIEEFDNMR